MSNAGRKDGGPAYPVTFEHGMAEIQTRGMSLRDFFAGQALPSAIVMHNRTYMRGNNAEYARIAYEIADAMIQEREK